LFRAFGDSAFDLVLLPVVAFASLWGLRAGLISLVAGAGLVGLWALSVGVPLNQVLDVPHAVGDVSLVIAFGIMQQVLADKRRQGSDLRRSLASIRSIVESAPLILWAVDADGRFVVRDGKGLAAVGEAPGGWVGRSAREFCRTVYPECPELLIVPRARSRR
jgi:PAS domain-containing protein